MAQPTGDRRFTGVCPPGYTLRHVEGFWACVRDDGHQVNPNTKSVGPQAVINPCPPGYKLVKGDNGKWMCQNVSSGHIVDAIVAASHRRAALPGGGGGDPGVSEPEPPVGTGPG